jgi:hypothetical protein
MRKRIAAIIVAVFVSAMPAMAQLYIMEDDENVNRLEGEGTEFNIMVPAQDVNNDQYVPLAGGVWALSGLAGLYLLTRRRHCGTVLPDDEN